VAAPHIIQSVALATFASARKETDKEKRAIMSAMSLQVQVKSLEAQLSVLKAQLSSGAELAKPRELFGSLYGILSGKGDSTEEDIRAARYRDNWDGNTEQ
jgi:hypothetical protein